MTDDLADQVNKLYTESGGAWKQRMNILTDDVWDGVLRFDKERTFEALKDTVIGLARIGMLVEDITKSLMCVMYGEYSEEWDEHRRKILGGE